MTVSLGTAYRSFDGEVEASNTPTICRLHRFMPSPTFGHSSKGAVGSRCFQCRERLRVIVGIGFDVLYVHRLTVDKGAAHNEVTAGRPGEDGVIGFCLFGGHLVDG